MSKVPLTTELLDVQEAFRSVQSELLPFQSGFPDLHGRRFINVGDAQKPNEWITKAQADAAYMPVPTVPPRSDSTTVKPVRIGPYSSRGLASAFAFTIFEANDRNYVAWASDGSSWRWAYGLHIDTLANKPTLTTTDEGYLFAVSDYAHILRWNGTAFTFLPGDSAGYVVVGKPDGSAPNGGVWGLCDGSTYNVLKPDGTVEGLLTQDLTGDTFVLGGTSTDASPRVATRATWETTAKTDDAATGMSIDSHTTVDVQSGTGTTVLNGPVSHTLTDPNHHHALSDANAQLKKFSEANGGLPKRSGVAFYIRR